MSSKTDIAVVVVDPELGLGEREERLLEDFLKNSVPTVLALTKRDIWPEKECLDNVRRHVDEIYERIGSDGKILHKPQVCAVSAVTGQGIEDLVDKLSQIIIEELSDAEPPIVGDLLEPGDIVFLVVPVDLQAPKGRLILPQVQNHQGCN